MFSPPLYTVRKIPLKYLIDNNYDLQFEGQDENQFHIKQQDNLLFRQIRLITGDTGRFNRWITFVNAKGGKSYTEELSQIITNGFKLKNQEFVISERSASMTRTSILSFVDKSIEDKLDERVSMGLDIGKTVLSKWYAYRGLMLSSCHCLEDWYPKIIVVPDYYRVIPNQKIKHVYDKTIQFIDKNGSSREWTQKDITEDTRDIEINVFDGCGIHHPEITRIVQEKLNSTVSPTSILWRAPYIKGVTHQLDYVSFFAERGVKQIKDVWGQFHDVTPGSAPMIIMCESMYKGMKYFKKYGDIRDWEDYWRRFRQYEHCIGVAKWNFSSEEEPIYTRANYQVLQDLDLPYSQFALLAKESVDWVEKIANGDIAYTMCFLGIRPDNQKPLNNYVAAILKNQEMLKEEGVRAYLVSLVKKYIDGMKCGKLFLKGCFKFLSPDLIMLMEHIGELPPNGCLEENEFFAFSSQEQYLGERLIERNPHICKSEHTVLCGTTNEMTEKYCRHLQNVCMINGKSITPQRLNGADFDGDLVLVIDNQIMMNGTNRNAPITIDVDDKITVEAEPDTKENKLKIILRTMNSLIGETSNCATAYHNKTPRTIEQKTKYESYIDLLSVINGKSIDFAKTGVLYNIPRNIAKFGRPLPYFMKYRSDYYAGMKKLSRSNSNMNLLCYELERWDKTIRWKRHYQDFDHTIMIDNSIPQNKAIEEEIEREYLAFCKEIKQLSIDQKEIRTEINGGFEINWQYYYELYHNRCRKICPNPKELANIAVRLCYEKYPQKSKKFMWRVAGDGIVANIKQLPLFVPQKDVQGEIEYLGRSYSFTSIENREEFD